MIACLFPGQGSQSCGLGRIYHQLPEWEWVTPLSDAMDLDLAYLMLDADDDELRLTTNTQAVAFCRNWLEWAAVSEREDIGGHTDVVYVGHSVGEYSALAAAGALDPLDAARVVAARGRAMDRACEAVGTGMVAVTGEGCAGFVESAIARSFNGELYIANVNAPQQVVIAGPNQELDVFSQLLRDLDVGLRTFVLPVGGAFHTPFMTAARDDVEKVLRPLCGDLTFAPVMSNADASVHTSWETLTDAMVEQVVTPVRWDLCGEALGSIGVEFLWESAPKSMLSAFAKRANPDRSFVRVR